MFAMQPINWHDVFVPDVPLLEIFVRGSLVYLALFLLLRIVLKRQSGNLGVSDLLVIVLIADAAQNAMSSDYKSLPDGIFLVATIVFWSYVIDWLSYYIPAFGRLVRGKPLELIRDGKPIRQNMRRELVTMDELKEQLREQGINDLDRVQRACMEADGRISVVTTDEKQHPKPKQTST